jgi:hypothetical protein
MKTIICGSHTASEKETMAAIESAINQGAIITEVVIGFSPGAETYSKCWANKMGIPVKQFTGDWEKNGIMAVPIRNAEMVSYADQCIVVSDVRSMTITDMVRKAKAKGLKLFVCEVQK